MARLMMQERGAVYVEFLIAFFPLFLLFLALCQLALVGAAEAVVRHAAYSAVRSAIVILEDDPERFDGAQRGSLSQGRPRRVADLDDIVSKLGLEPVAIASRHSGFSSATVDHWAAQHGARMAPIRAAGLLQLLPLAPNERLIREAPESVANALAGATERQLGFAAEYSRAAAIVSMHDSRDTQALAVEPVAPKAMVTARVTYLFHCTVPLVRVMMCRSLRTIGARGLLEAAVAYKTAGLAPPDARFKLLSATASLPNQGASYLRSAP